MCSCNKDEPAPTRTFRMGFQNSAPRFDDFNLFVKALQMWVDPGNVADAAMITTEVPWKELLGGQSAVKYVVDNYAGLAAYYRQHNLKLWVYVDPGNGLNRSSDAQALVDAGKSIADDETQTIYNRFVIVMDSVLKPEHLGLALEVNMIRIASPPSIYSAIRKAANDVASKLKLRNSKALLSVSVQADVSWGSITGTYQYTDIQQELSDFGFIEELGISSYPYFGYTSPADIPHDYYSKIADEAGMPVFVSEGGWPSQSFAGPNNAQIVSSESRQAEYFSKQAELLTHARAIGLFSLTFTDIDVSAIPPGVDPTIQYFTYLGVVDKDLKEKEAFEKWRELFARELLE